MKLTKEQKGALNAIKGGADVYSYAIAKELRGLEKTNPELLEITTAMQAPKDGAKQQPYFGAILTAKGKKAIKNQR